MATEVSCEHRETISENQVLRRLKKIAKKSNYANPCFHVTTGTAKGENFLGDIFRTTIEGERDGKFKRKSFIIKCVPKYDFSKDIIKVPMIFQREIMFYREIVPIFQKLLHEHGLELEDIPKFYGADDTPDKEIVVLEDLREKGYELRDRLKLLDYPHASLAVRSLGRFHAYSFALRDKDAEIFEKIRTTHNVMRDMTEKPNKSMMAYQNRLTDLVLKALSNHDPYYVNKVTKFVENLSEKMIDATQGSHAEPYAVLCHGDSWTNNFLFKYDDEAKTKPTSMYLLDFQLCRYASPVTDILYTLFCCCSQETRREHYKQLLLDYHESLSNCLRQLGCDPEILFPYEAFEQQLQRYGFYGAAMATFTLHVITDVNADVREMSRNKNFLNEFEARLMGDKFFRNMLISAFVDSVDMSYI